MKYTRLDSKLIVTNSLFSSFNPGTSDKTSFFFVFVNLFLLCCFKRKVCDKCMHVIEVFIHKVFKWFTRKKINHSFNKLACHTVGHFGSTLLTGGYCGCWSLSLFTSVIASRRFLHHVGVTKIYSKKLNLTKSQTSSATSRMSSRRALAVDDGVDASSVVPGWVRPRGSGSVDVQGH